MALIPAVYVILRQGDEVLLIKRQNTGYMDGKWGMPSGHVEDREKPTIACVRESKEEIGVDIDPNDLEFVLVNQRISKEDDHERLDYFFVAKKWSGEIINAEPHKCAAVEWFPLDDLPQNLVPEVAHALPLYETETYFSDEQIHS